MRGTFLLFGCALVGACNGSGGTASSSEGEVRAANAAYDRALLDGDAGALERLLTDDYSIIDDDAAVHGKRNQIDVMTRQVDLLDVRGDDERVTMLGPNAALVTGRLAGRYRMGGQEAKFTERYTSIWVRENGEWRVRHEHASLVPVAAAAE